MKTARPKKIIENTENPSRRETEKDEYTDGCNA